MFVNYIAVLVAGVAGWLVGAAWYGVLGKPWTAALGWTAADMTGPDGKRKMPMGPMITAFFAQIVMALMLAGLISHVGQLGVMPGVMAGALVWIGFVATVLSVNYGFQKRPFALLVIDGGHWLAVLLIQGAILGAWH